MNPAEDIQFYKEKNHFLEEKIISLEASNQLYQKRCEQYAQACDFLQHQINELRRYRFGTKSERFIDPEHPQLSLFEENAHTFPEAEVKGDALEDEVKIAAHTRKKKSKSGKDLPRRIEIIPVSEADMQCSCGCQKKVIRYEKKEILNYQPAVFEIIEQRREVVVCDNGCDGAIMTAPAPLQVLPKISVSESFLAFLVVSKLDDRQPLYHLEKQLSERHGVNCSRQSMAGWMIDLMEPMQPLWNLLKDEAIEYDVASCDATTFPTMLQTNMRSTAITTCGG
jgi:transposase